MTEPAATYERHPPQTLAKQVRQRKAWDVALSIVLVVVANAAFVLGAIFALLGVAFTATCHMGRVACDVSGGPAIPFAVGAIIALLALIGTVVTVLLLVWRRRGWWLAAATLIVVVLGWIVAFLLFALSF